MTGWLAEVAAAILGAEALGLVPATSRAVIWLATILLPRERRKLRRREWTAELEAAHSQRPLAGFTWAIGLIGICIWERATTPFRLSPKPLAVGAGVLRAGSAMAETLFVALRVTFIVGPVYAVLATVIYEVPVLGRLGPPVLLSVGAALATWQSAPAASLTWQVSSSPTAGQASWLRFEFRVDRRRVLASLVLWGCACVTLITAEGLFVGLSELIILMSVSLLALFVARMLVVLRRTSGWTPVRMPSSRGARPEPRIQLARRVVPALASLCIVCGAGLGLGGVVLKSVEYPLGLRPLISVTPRDPYARHTPERGSRVSASPPAGGRSSSWW